MLDTNNDPYIAAAYLRYWALQGHSSPPLFNVGVTFGTMIDGNEPFDFPLLNRKVSENGRMEGAWSGASRGWRGDAYFDNPDEELVGFNSRRLEGAEGIVASPRCTQRRQRKIRRWNRPCIPLSNSWPRHPSWRAFLLGRCQLCLVGALLGHFY